jgi:hypothetical protein
LDFYRSGALVDILVELLEASPPLRRKRTAFRTYDPTAKRPRLARCGGCKSNKRIKIKGQPMLLDAAAAQKVSFAVAAADPKPMSI